MVSVLTELSQWARTLQFWEQAALEKIVNGVIFTDADFNELLQYLLEDDNLAESRGQRPTLHFPQDSDTVSQTAMAIRLVQISNLQNVNALVPGQTLTFGQSLTTIYGGNGSGKSGYARVLGCAGFTRGDREVLPDVTQPLDDTVVVTADVQATDGTRTRDIHYTVGERCPELASFYVFDSTSVRVHLTQSNTPSFSPAGLSYLTRLAEITDKVRDYLRAKIEECSQPHNFSVLFQGDSEISRLINELGPQTDLKSLRDLANLTKEQEGRIAELDIKIAHLKAQDIPAQIVVLKQKIADLENLLKKLRDVQHKLSDQIAEDIQSTIGIHLKRQSAAQKVSTDQFRSEYFTQTGSDAWYQFIRAAKTLVDAERLSDEHHPRAESRCLLCQQPLSAEARDLLFRLWAFLESDAQAKLSEIQGLLGSKRKTLESISLDFFDDQSVSYRHLQEHNLTAFKRVNSLIGNYRIRRDGLLSAIADNITPITLSTFPEDPIPEIEQTIEMLTTNCDELEKKDPSEEITQLEQQMRELQHRKTLRQHFSAIQNYVQKGNWAQRASKAGGTTRHITKKHNDLFKELVTDRYVELFEQILQDLGRPLRVKVATWGRKGEVYKHIVLETDPSIPVDERTLDRVLSEGEKRAVALADFLTEVALDTTSNGIVLDDPVTSLDLEWRNLVASILVAQAKRRQVIVFTHDLPFLYFLKKYAEQENVEVATHWIKRGDDDNKPGYVFLNNSPALERDYRSPTRAREIYAKAKDAPPEEQESLLHDGFGALRTTYEAFIIFELLNAVVLRFDERISFGRLNDIIWDHSVVNEVVNKCETLSRYIEGHLHSDALGAQKPTASLLLCEIEAFDALNKKLKDLKKKK
ncbi:MAG: AAA family ATPase [Candidatus Zixiibacteriota bacterium]